VLLKHATASSIKWSVVSLAGRQGIQWAATVVLARLLAPSDFGLLTMSAVAIAIADLLGDLGTSSAVIQRKDPSQALLSSVFWTNVGIGLLSAVALFALSPLVASYYREPRISLILKVLALVLPISAAGTVQRSFLERDLAFQQLAKAEVCSALLASTVGIGMALHGYAVWSLVTQTLVASIATTILLWLVARWKPSLVYDRAEMRSIQRYSLNLAGFNIFNFFGRNADYLLIGRFLGTQNLGYYSLAYRIMFYPLQSISAVIGRVMFPVFARVQEDDSRLCRAYVGAASSIAVVTFPMMGGLMAVSDLFVLTGFGRQWMPVVPLLLILAPVGLLQSVGTTVGNIYQAKGRTDLLFRWGVFSGTLSILAFIVGLKWGIKGVAVAYAILSGILIVPAFLIPLRLIGLRFRRLLLALSRPLAATLIMFLCVGLARWGLPLDGPHWFSLASLVFLGIMVYSVASWTINRDQLLAMVRALGNH
jgi:O-antigen/teichoic acid export membrane protein